MALFAFLRKARFWKIFSLITAICIAFIIYGITHIHPFLAQTHRVDTEVLVVEGWLPNYALEMAAEEFKKNKYQVLLTIGGPLPQEFRLFTTGSLFYSLPDSLIPAQKPDSIFVTAFGSQVRGTFAHFTISVNDTVIGNIYTSDEVVRYSFATHPVRGNIQNVRIYFDNDAFQDGQDCDLYVRSLEVGESHISPNAAFVIYDLGKPDGIKIDSTKYRSYAAGAAAVLTGLGLDETQVIPIAAPKVRRHKTYNSLYELKDWLEENNYRSVNVVTLGVHARRSWLTAQRALGNDIKVGIVAIEHQRYDSKRWWMNQWGREVVSVEFIKYVYMKFFFDLLEGGEA